MSRHIARCHIARCLVEVLIASHPLSLPLPCMRTYVKLSLLEGAARLISTAVDIAGNMCEAVLPFSVSASKCHAVHVLAAVGLRIHDLIEVR